MHHCMVVEEMSGIDVTLPTGTFTNTPCNDWAKLSTRSDKT